MSIILTILVFSVLVFVHEFGHFIMAKKNGIGVVEFSIGMGPRLIKFEKGDTIYSWKLIPFGGSCQMLGEDEDVADNEKAFNNASVWARIVVLAAGPVFNFILAFILSVIIIGTMGYDPCYIADVEKGTPVADAGLKKGDVIKEFDGEKIVIARDLFLKMYCDPVTDKPVTVKYERNGKEYTTKIKPVAKYTMGVSFYADDKEAEITAVADKSSVEKAGIQTGDIIVELDGKKISTGKEIAEYLDKSPLTGEEITIKVKHGDKIIEKKIKPGKTYTINISYNTGRVKTGALGTLRYSFTEMRYDTESVFKSLKMLVTGKLSMNNVSGPVGIANIVNDAYQETKSEGAFLVFINIAYLTVLFSVNLGVMNLLPFPALDGGRLIFCFIEVIRRKPVPKEKEAIVHMIGMAILMIFMVFVLFNDIKKLM